MWSNSMLEHHTLVSSKLLKHIFKNNIDKGGVGGGSQDLGDTCKHRGGMSWIWKDPEAISYLACSSSKNALRGLFSRFFIKILTFTHTKFQYFKNYKNKTLHLSWLLQKSCWERSIKTGIYVLTLNEARFYLNDC